MRSSGQGVAQARLQPERCSVELLGPLSVQVGNVPVAIPGLVPRALFAVLALRAGEALTTFALIDGLWSGRLPRSPSGALQIAVSRLRKALGDLGARVVSSDGRYRLDVATDEVDVSRAQHLVEDAREARSAGDPTTTLRRVDEALHLWRGTPLAEFERFPFFRPAETRLSELRRALIEERNDALLALGRHVEVIDAAHELLGAERWHERFRAQEMLALYRAGRQAEALRAYEDLRVSLVEEFGVNPGPEVAALHARILQQDPALDLGARPSAEGLLPFPATTLTATSLPFVGRQAELEHLRDAWLEMRTRAEPRLVLVAGEPGVGKTRLALEVADRGAREAIVLIGRGDEGLGAPYRAIAEALQHLFAHLPARDLDRILEPISGAIAHLSPAIAELVSNPVGRATIEPDIARAMMIEDVVALLAAASALAPVYLLLDDLSWSNSATLEVVERLAAHDGPLRVLLVATARSNDPDRSAAVDELTDRLATTGRCRRLDLGRLTEADTAELVARAEPDAPDDIADLVHRITNGNPFFAAEVLRDLHDRSTDTVGSEGRSLDVPENVRSAVRRRAARLGAETVRLLGIGSIFGSSFPSDVLAEVAAVSDAALERLLDGAIDAQLIEAHDREFRFSHELTRLSLLDAVPNHRQATLHRDIALALEPRAGAWYATPAVIGDHWVRAGIEHRPRVFRWARRAGREAEGKLDPFEAARWYEIAASAARTEHDRVAVLVDLGRTRHLAGDPCSRETLLDAASRAEALGDTDSIASVGVACANCWTSSAGVDRERVAVLDAAAGAATGAPRATILASMASELHWDADHEFRMRLSDEALAVARDAHDDRALAYALCARCHAIECPHTLEERGRNADEAVAITEALDDPVLRQEALGVQMAAAIERGDLECVDANLSAATMLAKDTRLPRFLWGTAIHRAWRHALTGDLEGAEELIDAAVELGRRSGQATADAVWSAQLICLRWQQGRLGELVPVLVGFADAAPELAAIRAVLALAHHEAGDELAAGAEFAAARAAGFSAVHRNSLWTLGIWAWTETAVALGDDRAAASLADRLAPWQDQVAFTSSWVLGPVAVPVARAFAAGGRSEEAERAHARAVEVARGLRAEWIVEMGPSQRASWCL